MSHGEISILGVEGGGVKLSEMKAIRSEGLRDGVRVAGQKVGTREVEKAYSPVCEVEVCKGRGKCIVTTAAGY